MTYTEEQFTQAMKQAVAQRGEDYRFPRIHEAPKGYWTDRMGPAYSTPEGEPACLIGLALHILTGKAPAHDVRLAAAGVMYDVVHESAIPSAILAQQMQDAGRPWGEVLQEYLSGVERDKRKRAGALQTVGYQMDIPPILLKEHFVQNLVSTTSLPPVYIDACETLSAVTTSKEYALIA